MSSKIDERVVAMKFNSGDFAKGVAETSSALDKLKAALQLNGAGKDFQSPSLKGLSDGISDATSRFDNLRTIGLGALLAIGAKAVDVGIQLAQNLGQTMTKDARAGFAEYETKIGSIQTILANTARHGTTLETVNTELQKLNEYADKTIYNFGEMTRNVGLFTNAGIKVEDATSMIKGFSNAAAASGATAEPAARAAYQLSQALSTGTLRAMDWISLTNAGMGNKNMQDGLIQIASAMGMFNDSTTTAEAAGANFKGSLEDMWLSTDVMSAYLRIMTGDMTDAEIAAMGLSEAQVAAFQAQALTASEAAEKVRTFSQLMATLGEAAGSGWGRTFEIIFGGFNEATDLFSMLSYEMGGFVGASADARNAQVELWDSLGGRTAIVEAISNVFAALKSVLGPIGAAWAQVFPPSLGKTMAAISFAIRDFTAGLILSENAQANLKMVALALFSVLKFGVDIVMGVAKVLGFLIGFAFDLTGAIFGLLTPILNLVRGLIPVKEGAEETTSAVSTFFDMLVGAGRFLTGGLISGLRNLSQGFDNFLNDGQALSRIKEFGTTIKDLALFVAFAWNILTTGTTGGVILGGIGQDSDIIPNLYRIHDVLVDIIDGFKNFGKGVADAGSKAASFWKGISAVVATVWGYIEPIAKEVGKFFGDIMSGLDLDTVMAGVNAGVLVALAVGIGKMVKSFAKAFGAVGDIKKSFVGALDELGGALGRFGQETKADKLIKIAGALIILAGALFIISQIDPDRLVSSVAGMATAFGILLGGMAILDKIEAEPSIKASVALSLIAVAVNILATAVAKMGALDPQQLTSGLLGIAAAMGILIVAAQALDGMEDSILKSSVALVIMAGAILVMAGAVAIFGNMPVAVLEQGIGSVLLILGALVVAAAALEKYASGMVLSAVGLMAMAAALNMLVIPISVLGLMPIAVLSQGLLVLGVMLFGLVVAAQNLSAAAPRMLLAAVAMMAMAAAINMMLVPVLIMSSIPFANLLLGLAGLGLMMLLLVLATNAMTTAMPGAVAMIAVAGAILILSVALAVLNAIGLQGVIEALIGLGIAILMMVAVSVALAPLIPVMASIAGVMALFALGVLALSVALLIGVAAIGLLGPALLMAVGGIVVFAKSIDLIVAAAGPMALLGAALLAFGAGALVAGAGAILLGAGLILLGVGLALVGAVGILGAVALAKVVEKIVALVGQVPGMLIMAGTFLALGAAIAVLGAGMVVLGVGALLTGTALLMIAGMGGLVALSINMIIKSIERLAPMSEQVSSIASSLGKLGSATTKLADSGRQAASGLIAISVSFTNLATGARVAQVAITSMASSTGPAISMMIASVQRGPAAFQLFAVAVVGSMTTMNSGLTAGANQARATATNLGGSVGGMIVNGIRGSYGSVYSASVTLGSQMTAGMNQGLQNGSGSVSSMASRVAQNALSAAKRTLGVASPSKEFAWLGEMSDKGLANGLLNNAGIIDRAGTEVGNTALNAVRESLSDLKNAVATDMNFNPTIKPVFDMSAIKKGAGVIDGILTPPTLRVGESYAKANSLALQQEARAEALEISSSNENDGPHGDTYNQYITSPKAVSNAEIYRNTKNLISVKKGESPT